MAKLIYRIGRLTQEEEQRLDFSDGLGRSVDKCIELGFIPMYLPVIEDKGYRIFNTTKEYREWCNKALPKWLGYSNA